MSGNLEVRMDEALECHLADRNSYFQLLHFVVGKEITIQGKMWQCLKEIKSRKNQINALKREIEEVKDRLELIDIQKGDGALVLGEFLAQEKKEQPRRLAIRRNEIINRQLSRQQVSLTENIEHLKEKLKYTEEETTFFLNTLSNLKKIEELKPLDDLESQKEYWTQKLANDVHLKLILHQPLDVELVKLVLTLHDDSSIKQEICSLLTTVAKNSLKEIPNKEEACLTV